MFDAAGQVATTSLALELTANGGATYAVGIYPEGATVPVAVAHLHAAKRLIGVRMGDVDPGVDIPPGRRYLDGELLLDQLITDRWASTTSTRRSPPCAVEARTIVTFLSGPRSREAIDEGEHLPPGARRPHPLRRAARSSRSGRRWTTTSTTRIRSPAAPRGPTVFFAEQVGHLVLTRMDDIEAVFTNPDVFASTNVQDPLFPWPPRPRRSSPPRTSTRSP